ncbi:hypothetical protein [Clostridium sp. UBA4548]|nr:hypothetical protein [Clostridium sp. UBA4548]
MDIIIPRQGGISTDSNVCTAYGQACAGECGTLCGFYCGCVCGINIIQFS